MDPLTIVSISSSIAPLIRVGDFKERMVLKLFRASRASSACFLSEDSDGITVMFVGAMDMMKNW